MGRRVTATAIVSAACALLAMPAGAWAAVTIGEDTDAPGTGSQGCSFMGPPQNCTFFNSALPNRVLAAPDDGVVVRWRVLGAATGTGPVRLRIVRPVGGNTFTGAGTGAFEAINAGLHVFDARLPIAAGDLIGIDIPFNSLGQPQNRSSQPGAAVSAFGPYLVDGGPPASPSFGTFNGFSIVYNADIEPDADSDGFGDETQDECPTDASKQGDCTPPDAQITKGPKDKTKNKRATFEFTGLDARAIAGFECSLDGDAFTACASPFSVKVKKGKHTFSVRAIDQAGNVDGSPATDKWKVKKRKKKR